MRFLSKLKFLWKKQPIVVITGNGRKTAFKAVLEILNQYFKIPDEILIFKVEDKEIKKFKFFLKNSKKAVIVITHIGDIPSQVNFFSGERKDVKNTMEVVRNLSPQVYLVLNFDDETVREIDDFTNLKTVTFGFQKQADFMASDVKFNGGTNFKVNYKGNVVPIWLNKMFGKEYIYSALCAIAVGSIFELNLVKISQAFKGFTPLSGKMALIKGIKNSFILDDSESASVFSMIEALEILGKLEGFNRKIAVLGDIVGVGKYTIEAHEAIGEKVAKNSDLLFTFGPRAKFIAKGAIAKGMNPEYIFQFNKVEEGKIKLQNKIKEKDLILVDGSKEMNMAEIIQEIKGEY